MKAPTIALSPGCLIRYRYRGQFEYAIWNGDNTRTLLGTQADLNYWRNLSPSDKTLGSRSIHGDRQRELMNGASVIQGVWKGDQFEPRKIITP